jgi:hypothetical protein
VSFVWFPKGLALAQDQAEHVPPILVAEDVPHQLKYRPDLGYLGVAYTQPILSLYTEISHIWALCPVEGVESKVHAALGLKHVEALTHFKMSSLTNLMPILLLLLFCQIHLTIMIIK